MELIRKRAITLWRLGLINLIWVFCYRVALKLGYITRNMKIGSAITGPFFGVDPIEKNPSLESSTVKVFGWIEYLKQEPPVWHQSVTSGKPSDVQALHWSKISDFDLDVGDIKTVWDLSRFDWVIYFVIEYLRTGDESNLSTLNRWLEDWSANNPVNQGINWKCGQEASIRVMHLCFAAFLLGQHKSLSDALIRMLTQHLHRISPTVLYAIAQDNNHGTSEAVALFIGGLILENNASGKQASKWKRQGRFWIENRTKRLIASDGSFSQHSVNYHRLMLDSMSLAETLRIKFGEQSFSNLAMKRFADATEWLNVFVDPVTGDVPNIGANDGARIIPLTNTDYRDYRPSARLASAVFLKKRVFSDHVASNQLFTLLRLQEPDAPYQFPQRRLFDDGGYLFCSNHDLRLFLKYPRYRFRPSHCDALHLDVWLGGRNIFRDAGSYSYNADPLWMDYFPGTAAHNSVQFDEQEQMPRISRFLYGDWLGAVMRSDEKYSSLKTDFGVSYKNRLGHFHQRTVSLTEESLCIRDSVDGFNDKAVIRWRLIPGQYVLQGNTIFGAFFKLSVEATSEIKRFEILPGWESRYYFQKTELPVLEVEISKASVVTTKIVWGQG